MWLKDLESGMNRMNAENEISGVVNPQQTYENILAGLHMVMKSIYGCPHALSWTQIVGVAMEVLSTLVLGLYDHRQTKPVIKHQ